MARPQRSQKFVSRVYWPLDASTAPSGFLVGWNVRGFVACVATVVPHQTGSLADIEAALTSLALDRTWSQLRLYCSGNPIVLGQWRGAAGAGNASPSARDAADISEHKHTASLWLTMSAVPTAAAVASAGKGEGAGSAGSDTTAAGVHAPDDHLGAGVAGMPSVRPVVRSVYCCGCPFRTSPHVVFYTPPQATERHYFASTSYNQWFDAGFTPSDRHKTDLDLTLQQVNSALHFRELFQQRMKHLQSNPAARASAKSLSSAHHNARARGSSIVGAPLEANGHPLALSSSSSSESDSEEASATDSLSEGALSGGSDEGGAAAVVRGVVPPATPPSIEVKDERLGHRPANSDGDDHGGSLATPPSASRRGSSPFGSSDGTLGLRRRRHGSGTSGGRLSHKRAHRRRASSTASGASGDGIAAATARRGSRRGSRRRRGSSATGIEALGIGDTDDNELHKLTPPVSCYTSAALTARRRSRACQLLTQLWWRPTLVLVVLLGWMARGILVVLALKVPAFVPIFGGYRLRQQLWTLNQLDHRLRQFLSWPSLLRSLNNCGWQRPSDYVAAEAQLKGSIALVIVDIALGLLFGLFLYQHRAVSGTVLSNLHHYGEMLHVEVLRSHIEWLMDLPAGFKLNRQFDRFLGQLALHAIDTWNIITNVLTPLEPLIVALVACGGFLGFTFILTMAADALNMLTVHMFYLYMVFAKLHYIQMSLLKSLWNLFRGKKHNVLRERVDSADYSVLQLLLGTVLFCVVMLLAPTSLVFYVFFSLSWLVILVMQATLWWLLAFLNHFPFYLIYVYLSDKAKLPGGIHIGMLSRLEVVAALPDLEEEDGDEVPERIIGASLGARLEVAASPTSSVASSRAGAGGGAGAGGSSQLSPPRRPQSGSIRGPDGRMLRRTLSGSRRAAGKAGGGSSSRRSLLSGFASSPSLAALAALQGSSNSIVSDSGGSASSSALRLDQLGGRAPSAGSSSRAATGGGDGGASGELRSPPRLSRAASKSSDDTTPVEAPPSWPVPVSSDDEAAAATGGFGWLREASEVPGRGAVGLPLASPLLSPRLSNSRGGSASASSSGTGMGAGSGEVSGVGSLRLSSASATPFARGTAKTTYLMLHGRSASFGALFSTYKGLTSALSGHYTFGKLAASLILGKFIPASHANFATKADSGVLLLGESTRPVRVRIAELYRAGGDAGSSSGSMTTTTAGGAPGRRHRARARTGSSAGSHGH